MINSSNYGGKHDGFDNMIKNRDKFYEEAMESSSHQTAQTIKAKVSIMKEPLLRKILSGEKITKEEDVRLVTISDIENMIDDYINEMSN